MKKEQKTVLIENFKAQLTESRSAMLVDYRGLTVAQLSELRNQLRKSDVKLHIIKNTLARIAIQNTPFQPLKTDFVGPIAVAYTAQKHFNWIKILCAYQDTHPNLKLRPGVFDGSYVAADRISELMNVPSWEQLMAKVVGSLYSPLQVVIAALKSPMRNIAYILKQHAEQAATPDQSA